MALGLSPKHVQDIPLENLTAEHSLIIALETVQNLGWKVAYISNSGLIAHTQASMSSWGEEFKVIINSDSISLKSECAGSQMMDWGKNKKNVESFTATFSELKSMLSTNDINQKLEELRPTLNFMEDDILIQPPTKKEKLTAYLSLFTPTQGYFITPILINLNLIVFILMAISGVNILMPDQESLIWWGANFQPLTYEGQWWRLLSACFVHIGILHLIVNIYALLYIGLILEPILGKTRFLAAYLISGISSSMTSLWWNEWSVSAGASGAIFGLCGVFLALLTARFLAKPIQKAQWASILIFVVYNLLSGLSPSSTSIDNAAHMGGLLSGLIIGYAFIPSLKDFKNTAIKISTIGMLSITLLIYCFTVYAPLSYEFEKYEKGLDRFFSMESMALGFYNLPAETHDEKVLSEIKSRGLYYWNENIKLIESFKALDLPSSIRERNRKLKEYCQLRVKSYELIYKAIEEDTDKYENEIKEYHRKIESMILELKGE